MRQARRACLRSCGRLQQSRRAALKRENLVCGEGVLKAVLAPATAFQLAVEAVKCGPIFVAQSFNKLGRYSAGMCEVGKGKGRGVGGFYHAHTIAFWFKSFIRKAMRSSKFADVQKLRVGWDGGWARVEGAQGKIKGGGVTSMLTHCLHIVFRNSTT